MTTGSTSNNHHALHPRDDRETLSALFDGELAADAMRFALKRLDHDAVWRNTCGRWQLIGDALRGEATIAAPSDFASGVTRMLAAELQAARMALPVSETQAALPAQGISRRRWIGGAALAASVAMAAVLAIRPFSETSSSGSGRADGGGCRDAELGLPDVGVADWRGSCPDLDRSGVPNRKHACSGQRCCRKRCTAIDSRRRVRPAARVPSRGRCAAQLLRSQAKP